MLHGRTTLPLFFLITSLTCTTASAETPPSGIGVHFEPNHKKLFIQQMHTFEQGISDLLDALAQQDYTLVAKRAKIMGPEMSRKLPNSAKKSWPTEFKKIGGSVHNGFLKLGLDAELEDPHLTLKQLSSIIKSCHACHAQYDINP